MITLAVPDAGALFAALRPQAPDALLSLIKLFREDPRPDKIDLGVGVYRDAAGKTPVFKAVKAAEAVLQSGQPTKAYLGPEGDIGFLERIQPVVFGQGAAVENLFAVQTPGGTGALRLAAELANTGRPGARIWLGTPSWPNHDAIFAAAGLQVVPYRAFNPKTQTLCFDDTIEALLRASPGDIVLLHGCCHNPSGADPSTTQWRLLTEVIVERGLVPLIDLAYQGLGEGLEPDAAGLRMVLAAVDNALVAYSCDKNFGLYRERTGALFVRARGHDALIRSNTLQLARCAWSMPPDHGAAVARVILESAALDMMWRDELEAMRQRLMAVRHTLAQAVPALAPLHNQHGLFALLPLAPAQIEALRRDHAVYMAAPGRINLAGLTDKNIPKFAQALEACGLDLSR
jgi:aromatic-amino-acid transaminase